MHILFANTGVQIVCIPLRGGSRYQTSQIGYGWQRCAMAGAAANDPPRTFPYVQWQIIQSGATSVKIHGEQVPIRAHVESMENLSGHADYGEILRWLGRFPKAPQRVHLVHGEPAASKSLKEKITDQLHWDTAVAAYLEKIAL